MHLCSGSTLRRTKAPMDVVAALPETRGEACMDEGKGEGGGVSKEIVEVWGGAKPQTSMLAGARVLL